MADNLPRSEFEPTRPRMPDRDSVMLLVVWLVAQTLAIVASARQWALSANYPRPADSAALEAMLVVQIAVGGMLLPFMHRHGVVLACALASVVPFTLLAGVLAERQPLALIQPALQVFLWLAGLGLLGSLVRAIHPSEVRQPPHAAPAWVAALATLWSVGGALIWYLAGDADAPASWANAMSPIVAMLHPPQLATWVLMISPIAAVVAIFLNPARTRHVIHNSYTA